MGERLESWGRLVKTGKRLERDSHFLCKVPVNSWRDRLIWWAFRRYLLNEDHFVIRQMFTGPRPRGTSPDATIKANATHRRMYLNVRERERRMASSSRLNRIMHDVKDVPVSEQAGTYGR